MTRLFDLLYNQAANYPIEKSLNTRLETGEWKSYSSEDVLSMAEQAASGLIKLGLKSGDKVAIVSYKNRPEWVIMDFAIQMAGLISIPLYPTISSGEYEYILNEAEVKAAFCGGLDLFDKLSEAQKNSKSLKNIYVFDEGSKGVLWTSIFDTSQKDEIEKIKNDVTEQDLATIIYTSGTTGNPKGVMLTHGNIMHVIIETAKFLPLKKGENVISFLPLCHIYERAVSFAYCYKGGSVHYCGTDNLSGPEGDLASVKPVVFTTVPRLLEKVYEAIYNKGLALEGIKRKLFFWALGLTNDFELDQKLSFGKKIKWNIADKLIFSKWRDALGGNIRMIVTGAAPCPSKIMRVFCAAGINVREAYGLTETSPTLTVNSLEPGGTLIGSVGSIIPGVALKIDDSDGNYAEEEGEILAHGPNVMQGYYKKPEINAQVFKEIDGKKWFCTGDVGKLVKGSSGREFLKITDRKKELLKTSGGKYVAPAPIENKMKEDFLIEQMMVVGDKQKFVTALIVPAEEALKNWCLHKGLSWTTLTEMIELNEVLAKYEKVIQSINPQFSHIEQVKKFKLVSSQWLPIHEDGSEAELTPTQKLKRRVIRKKFQKEIEEMYMD
ncbi:long-chain fatty acid--CoA ligase [Croceitalea sp. P059]|uniref:AMP-dependent synthetase/ligase n=1 Tax=Croceitalea sp. P059 TaxID=3075601 RepID=UPI002885B88F|nr:long-chain fatty acid--CoA ligase [Croceitalea sp. P059]MDT0539255.1 long-chain fatty acid--CoA ligase [Croceitalea sp. P059]